MSVKLCHSQREEHWLRLFEYRVKGYLGLGGMRLTGKWRRLCNEELNDLYSSTNIIPVIK
jgi:hypothetical protein